MSNSSANEFDKGLDVEGSWQEIEGLIADLKSNIALNHEVKSAELISTIDSFHKSLGVFARKASIFCNSDVFHDIVHPDNSATLIECSIDSTIYVLGLIMDGLIEVRNAFPAPETMPTRLRPECIRIWNEKLKRDARHDSHRAENEREAEDRIRKASVSGQPPSEWSALKYGFEPTEDGRDGNEEAQAGGGRGQAAAGGRAGLAGAERG